MTPGVQLEIAQPTAVGGKPSTNFGVQHMCPQDQVIALLCPCFTKHSCHLSPSKPLKQGVTAYHNASEAWNFLHAATSLMRVSDMAGLG